MKKQEIKTTKKEGFERIKDANESITDLEVKTTTDEKYIIDISFTTESGKVLVYKPTIKEMHESKLPSGIKTKSESKKSIAVDNIPDKVKEIFQIITDSKKCDVLVSYTSWCRKNDEGEYNNGYILWESDFTKMKLL